MKDYLLLREVFPPNAGIAMYQLRRSILFLFLFLFGACISVFAQQRTVTGRVLSADSALAGVTVQVKGTANTTQTDGDGRFTISAPANATLVFSSVGFGRQEVAVGNSGNLTVSMTANAGALNEVVVVGYGTQRKATVTGSVAAVKGTELDKSPVLNLSNSLAGRLPGITAIQSSGEPGYDASTIRIRGTNTLGNSSPLIVIDGVPDRAGGLDRLNPADIETMSVLKDASAAIYGARAANGVILITTKQGRAGKPVVSYDFNQGWAQPTRLPALSNSAQYAELLNEQILFKDVPADQWGAAWQAFNTTGSYAIPGTNRIARARYSPEDLQKFRDGSSPLTHPNSDWFGATMKQWSPQQQHNVQVSGGSENVRFLSSIGHQNQDAFYKNSATGYKQYDFRINLDAKVSNYISTNLGIVGREEFRFFPTRGAGSIFRMLMRGKPTDVAIWPNGLPGPDIENGENPVVITTNQTGYDRDRRHFLQTNGEVVIRNPWIEGLKVTLQGAADRLIRRTKRWETPWYLYTWNDQTQFEADGSPKLTRNPKGPADPRLTQGDENELRINLTGLINYDHKFNDAHGINLLAGVQKETREGDNFFAFRRYFISPAVDQLFAGGAQEQNIGGGGFQQARLSYFGRANYNYREKYLAEFVWRYDGSYIFPEDKRFGFFPGVLLGWNISREDFFKNVTIFNNLKLRASYGQMGNDRLNLPDYAYLPTYSLTGTQVINGQVMRTLTEARVPNLDFTWEVANNANLGLEGTMLNNRLFFEFDVFNNQRKQILIQRAGSTPQSSGISGLLPPVNAGHVENKGWEFRVGYNGIVNKDFTFNVSVNGGYARNKVIFWDEPPGAPDYQRSTGKSFGTSGFNFLSFKYAGVFKDAADISSNKIDYSAVTSNLRPGDMKFEDVNGDGKINGLDAVRLDQNRDPRFTGGLNLSLQYKGFDLSALFQGAAGGLLLLNIHETGDFGNYPLFQYNERWSVNNPNSKHPRLASRGNTYYTNNGQFYGNNTYWLRNNDYLRLKNMEIGYNLNPSIAQRVGLSRLRVYAQALNLITWDKMKVFDPESTSSNAYYYPQSRIISTGVRVTF